MKSNTKQAVIFLATLALACWVSLPGFAQTTRGTITGTISDESGAVVAGAKVTVTQIDTGYTWGATTDSSGNYVVPSLFPGRYRVEAVMNGFQKIAIEPLELHVGERLAVNPVLKVGAVNQEIQVTSQGSMVDTTSASISQVVGSALVLDLPLNGRNFSQLALLSPGATPVAMTGSDAGGFNFVSLNVSGGRESSNQFAIDGVYNNAVHFEGLNVALSLDAMQEFIVQRNTFNAEFGSGTAQINVASKSGSNHLHGSVYEFFRNDVLDARQFFDVDRPPYHQNQFGVAVGGPIRKDKTFFFFNYEGLRIAQGNTMVGTMPTAQMLAGNFSGMAPIIDPTTYGTPGGPTPFLNNQIPLSRISPISKNIIGLLPTVTTGGANNYGVVQTQSDRYNQYTGRVDHRISNKDTLFGRYTVEAGDDLYLPRIVSHTGDAVSDAPTNAVIQWTHIFSPTLLSESRFGFNRNLQVRLQDHPSSKVAPFLNVPWLNAPAFYGMPLVELLGYTTFGTNNSGPDRVGGNTFQYEENLTWVRGNHTFKFGGEFRNIQFANSPIQMGRGLFEFEGFATGNSVADFLLGNPLASLGAGHRPSGFMSFKHINGYAQDDWKVNQRLTLNYGIRYERIGVDTDRFRGHTSVFDEKLGEVVPGSEEASLGLLNPDNRGFGPRFGFALQPFGNSHTVIRGGYGVYNDVRPINERNFGLGTELAWQQIVDINPLIGLPPAVQWDALFPAVVPTGTVGILTDDPFARTPYVQQYSLGLERSLPGQIVVEAGYVGSAARKLNNRIDINQASLPAYPGDPLAPRRPYPDLGSVVMAKDLATSNYNAFNLRVEKRFSANLYFLAAYTLSKSLDDSSEAGDPSGIAGIPQYARNMRAEYGLSAFDTRQRFVVSYLYLLPLGKGQRFLSSAPGVANVLISGWQINGITTFASGNPFTVEVSAVDRSDTGAFGGGEQRANIVGSGSPNLPSSQRTVQHWFNTALFAPAPVGTFGDSGRDIVIGPGTNNFDFSMFKNSKVTENKSIEFRAELFNIFNKAQFGIPVQDPTNIAFGQMQSVRAARQIQFGLKLLF